MMDSMKIMAGFMIGLIAVINVSAHIIDLPGEYVLTYEKISNTDNCLVDCSLKFRFKLNKDYDINSNLFLIREFKEYREGLDLLDSGFRIRSLEEYSYKNYDDPVYGFLERSSFCHGIQGVNFGLLGPDRGWCNDSLCLLNSTECYLERDFNSYQIVGGGVWFFYDNWEVIDYGSLIGHREVWRDFNPIGKHIVADKWYYIELWGKRKPSINNKPIFINISLMGKFLSDLSWWNSSWSKKKAIEINSDSNVNDYQLSLNVTYDSDMNNNFSDIRFTNEEEDNELDYWIENKVDGSYIDVWVEVDSIDTNNGTQAYLYYGNSGASSESNGTNTFLEFSDGLLEGDWDDSGNLNVSDSNGELRIQQAVGDYDGATRSISIADSKYILDLRIRTINTASADQFVLINYDGTTSHRMLQLIVPAQLAQGSIQYFDGSKVNIYTSFSFNTYYRIKIIIDEGTKTEYYVYDDAQNFLANANTTTFYGSPTDSDTSHIGSSASAGACDSYISWILYRKYTSPEPTYSIGSELTIDLSSPNISFISQSPSNLNHSSNGTLVIKGTGSDATGLNYSTFCIRMTTNHTTTGNLTSSVRYPCNNKSYNCFYRGEHMGEGTYCDEILPNIYEWSCHTGCDHINITWNGTCPQGYCFNFTFRKHDLQTIFHNYFPLDKSTMENSVMNSLEVYKNNNVIDVFYLPDIEPNATMTINIYDDENGGNKPEFFYICNVTKKTDGITTGSSPNCAYFGSKDSNSVHFYCRDNVCYHKFGLYVDGNYRVGGVKLTKENYIIRTSQVPQLKAYLRYYSDNTTLIGNVSMNNSKLLYTSSDNGITFTPHNGTGVIWISMVHNNIDEYTYQGYIEDNSTQQNGNWSYAVRDAIGVIPQAPETPAIIHIDGDLDLNGTYSGIFNIGCELGIDPNGDPVTGNLTLRTTAGVFSYLINGSFSDSGAIINISFDSTLVLNGVYKLNLTNCDDASHCSSVLTESNFTLDNPVTTTTTSSTTTIPDCYSEDTEVEGLKLGSQLVDVTACKLIKTKDKLNSILPLIYVGALIFILGIPCLIILLILVPTITAKKGKYG